MIDYEDFFCGLSEEEYEEEGRKHIEFLKKCCLTDEEIIDALEKEIQIANDIGDVHSMMINIGLIEDALDLINRQKAEIEKLTTELVGMRGAANSYKMHYDNAQAEIKELKMVIEAINDTIYPLPFETDFDKAIKTAKAEAIKEFAERLKEEIVQIPAWGRVAEKKIDNLVKEMVGE